MKVRALEKAVEYLRRKKVLEIATPQIIPDGKGTVKITGWRKGIKHELEVGAENVKVTSTGTEWL